MLNFPFLSEYAVDFLNEHHCRILITCEFRCNRLLQTGRQNQLLLFMSVYSGNSQLLANGFEPFS